MLELDFTRRTGRLQSFPPGESVFTTILQGTPASVTGAPAALLSLAMPPGPPIRVVSPMPSPRQAPPVQSNQQISPAGVSAQPEDTNKNEPQEEGIRTAPVAPQAQAQEQVPQSAHVIKAPTRSDLAEELQMATDHRTGCKAWKPNLQSNENVNWSGECLHGFANGEGIARWLINGKEVLTYEGRFVDGILQGEGIMIAAGGDRYNGIYKDGKRDGHGIYTTGNGQRYDGEFKDNKRHGDGMMTEANGISIRVIFRDGQRIN